MAVSKKVAAKKAVKKVAKKAPAKRAAKVKTTEQRYVTASVVVKDSLRGLSIVDTYYNNPGQAAAVMRKLMGEKKWYNLHEYSVIHLDVPVN